MKKRRTDEDRKHNTVYQARLYKKRRLLLKALKFIQWLYIHRPANIQPAQIRLVHIRIAHIMRLPYRWNEEDLRRAHNSLELLMKEVYNAKVGDFTGGYHDLLMAMVDTLQIYNATAEDRAKVISELMFNVAVELNAVYGNKKPPVSEALLLALAVGKPPYPTWVVNEMADFIIERFRQNESIHICNELYDKLAKAVAEQNKDVMLGVEEDPTDEMVIGGDANATVGHTLS